MGSLDGIPGSFTLTMNLSGSVPDIPHRNCKQYPVLDGLALIFDFAKATAFASQPVQLKFASKYEPKTRGNFKVHVN